MICLQDCQDSHLPSTAHRKSFFCKYIFLPTQLLNFAGRLQGGTDASG
jgi:hypothetical protein